LTGEGKIKGENLFGREVPTKEKLKNLRKRLKIPAKRTSDSRRDFMEDEK